MQGIGAPFIPDLTERRWDGSGAAELGVLRRSEVQRQQAPRGRIKTAGVRNLLV
jgi:hypothetical protein